MDNTDPFGFSVDLLDISTDNPRAISDSSDPVLHGPFGTVTGSILRDGTTFTLKPADNPNVKGLLYHTGSSGNTGAFFVTSTFGSGRVAIWGDSSPVDDGTGQSGNTLYNGWTDPAGTDADARAQRHRLAGRRRLRRHHGRHERGHHLGHDVRHDVGLHHRRQRRLHLRPAGGQPGLRVRRHRLVRQHQGDHQRHRRAGPHRLVQGMAGRLRHRDHRHPLAERCRSRPGARRSLSF